MAFEVFIVISLIVLFIVSLCSLLQKIRKSYDQDNDRRRITVSEVYVQDVPPPSYTETQREESQGVYPSGLAPPPYTAYFVEPPPKYDDVIEVNRRDLPATHQSTTQSQSVSVVSSQ